MTTLDMLLDTTLPLNRKERYYTGTVLPALLCADSMQHLARLGRPELLGLGALEVRDDPDDCTVLFFTEYSVVESAIGDVAARFPGISALPKDTPDVVILITEPAPVLIALEAKMYDRPSKPDLTKQLAAQRAQLDALCGHLAQQLDVEKVELAHWALLPSKLAGAMGDVGTPVVTWEAVLEVYADVDQQYFHAVLESALNRYEALVSKWAGYQDDVVVGSKVVDQTLAGETHWQFMGAAGGLTGARVEGAIADGTWASQTFQVRRHELPGNNNWFPVSAFIEKLIASGAVLVDQGSSD